MNRLASALAGSPLLPSSKFSRFALAVACLLTGLVIAVVQSAGHLPNNQLLSDLLQSGLVCCATVAAVWVTLDSYGYLRRLWLMFAVSLGLVTLAQVLETYYEAVAHTPFATPWPSDVLFLLWVIPALIMLLPRPDRQLDGFAWETILDFAQVGIVAVTAYLYFFYVTSRWEAEGPKVVMNEIWLQLYRDLAISAAFLFRARAVASLPVRALFRRISFFFLLSGGSSFSYLLTWPTNAERAHWYDVAWCVPYLFVTAIASKSQEEDAVSVKKPASPLSIVVFSRVLPACVPLIVLLMSRRIAHEQVTLAWTAITASFLVSTARLMLTNEKQLRVADNLRRTEAALQQSSEIFTTAFRSSLDAISISSVPDGRFLAVNESFLSMTGYTQGEVLGKSAADLRLWVDETQSAAILSRLYAGTEVRQEEFLMRTKTGEIRTGQVSAARVLLGERAGVLGMVRDVTARRRAEEALRVSEERFRTLVQDLHIGIMLLGPNDQALFANRAALDIFGVREEEILGKSTPQFEDIAIREDGQEIPSSEIPGPRAIATKKPVHGEVVGWRRAGTSEILWTLVDAIPHLTQQGEVANVILSISDITERKKAEQGLRESEERFRTLIENLHVGVALMGPRAEILFANNAALEIFGLSSEQVIGRTSEELGLIALREDGTEYPFEKRPAPRALATGQAVRSEVMGWRRPGEEQILWILGEVVPLSINAGRPNRLITTFSDITKRKEAEEALHHLSSRLLRLQDEERRRLGRELHDGLAQSVMAVNLDLAQVTRSPASLDKRARHALSEARRVLREMSRDIRTLSYLLHPPVLDELGLASALKEYAHGFSERSGIALGIDIQPGFPRMPQEAETAFFRIVQESLANIQKHSGSSTGTIRLWNGQGRVQLEIRDQGSGMVAKPGEGGLVPKASRLGVGILGMRERMAQLGGTLEIESGASGTAVHATIPLAPEGTHDTASHPRGG